MGNEQSSNSNSTNFVGAGTLDDSNRDRRTTPPESPIPDVVDTSIMMETTGMHESKSAASLLSQSVMGGSVMVGSFAGGGGGGTGLPLLESDDDDDDDNFGAPSRPRNHHRRSSKATKRVVPKINIDNLSTLKMAQHHLYLTGMCLAYARRREGDTMEDVMSNDLEYLIDDEMGSSIGPYPPNIWETWCSWRTNPSSLVENDDSLTAITTLLPSLLISEVKIQSIQQDAALDDYLYAICVAPDLDMVTVVLGASASNHRLGKGWTEYNGTDTMTDSTTFSVDSCWGDDILGQTALLEAILEGVEEHDSSSRLSVVGHGGGGALASIFGLWAVTRTDKKISIYSFGAPRLGDAKCVKWHDQLVKEGRLLHLRFINTKDPISKRPSSWSRYHAIGTAVVFTNKKERSLNGYWEQLQGWWAPSPVREWCQDAIVAEEKKSRRRSRIRMLGFLILMVYIPIFVVALMQPQQGESISVIDSSTSTLISDASTTQPCQSGDCKMKLGASPLTDNLTDDEGVTPLESLKEYLRGRSIDGFMKASSAFKNFAILLEEAIQTNGGEADAGIQQHTPPVGRNLEDQYLVHDGMYELAKGKEEHSTRQLEESIKSMVEGQLAPVQTSTDREESLTLEHNLDTIVDVVGSKKLEEVQVQESGPIEQASVHVIDEEKVTVEASYFAELPSTSVDKGEIIDHGARQEAVIGGDYQAQVERALDVLVDVVANTEKSQVSLEQDDEMRIGGSVDRGAVVVIGDEHFIDEVTEPFNKEGDAGAEAVRSVAAVKEAVSEGRDIVQNAIDIDVVERGNESEVPIDRDVSIDLTVLASERAATSEPHTPIDHKAEVHVGAALIKATSDGRQDRIKDVVLTSPEVMFQSVDEPQASSDMKREEISQESSIPELNTACHDKHITGEEELFNAVGKKENVEVECDLDASGNAIARVNGPLASVHVTVDAENEDTATDVIDTEAAASGGIYGKKLGTPLASFIVGTEIVEDTLKVNPYINARVHSSGEEIISERQASIIQGLGTGNTLTKFATGEESTEIQQKLGSLYMKQNTKHPQDPIVQAAILGVRFPNDHDDLDFIVKHDSNLNDKSGPEELGANKGVSGVEGVLEVSVAMDHIGHAETSTGQGGLLEGNAVRHEEGADIVDYKDIVVVHSDEKYTQGVHSTIAVEIEDIVTYPIHPDVLIASPEELEVEVDSVGHLEDMPASVDLEGNVPSSSIVKIALEETTEGCFESLQTTIDLDGLLQSHAKENILSEEPLAVELGEADANDQQTHTTRENEQIAVETITHPNIEGFVRADNVEMTIDEESNFDFAVGSAGGIIIKAQAENDGMGKPVMDLVGSGRVFTDQSSQARSTSTSSNALVSRSQTEISKSADGSVKHIFNLWEMKTWHGVKAVHKKGVQLAAALLVDEAFQQHGVGLCR